MHIKIGPYGDYIGVYQLADLLQKVGVSEEHCERIGDRLSKTQLNTFCEWVEDKRNRIIKVRIDKYDTWSMDTTLAYIILPMLKQLKETKHGAPNVDDKDVSKKLRSTSAPEKENAWDTDDNWHDRWDWVLDEMIWTFSQVNTDWQNSYYKDPGKWHFEDEKDGMSKMIWDKEPVINEKGLEAHEKRMQNGFILFGKYYSGLWS